MEDGKNKKKGMLVLSRKAEEAIIIGDDIVIKILGICGGQVKIGIEAPKDVPILRDELMNEECKR